MYSIKNRHTHVKGVKIDSVWHKQLLMAYNQKDQSLKVDTVQFVRQDYNIHLRGLSKEYSLREDSKRVWYHDGTVWRTKPLLIHQESEAIGEVAVWDDPGLNSKGKTDYNQINRYNPQHEGYQSIDGDIEIRVDNLRDLHIVVLPHCNP